MDNNLSKRKTKKPFGSLLKAKIALLKVSDKVNEPPSQKVDLDQLFTGKSSGSSLQSSHQSNDETQSNCSSLHEINSKSLDIDDIEIEDEDPPKDGTKTPNHRNLISKVKKNLKGKEKLRKADPSKEKAERLDFANEDTDLSPVGRARTIDEIKATYGQGKDQDATGGAAARLRDKLLQQRQKIQAIENRTAEMQEGAQNFHMMTEEAVKAIQEKNKRRFL